MAAKLKGLYETSVESDSRMFQDAKALTKMSWIKIATREVILLNWVVCDSCGCNDFRHYSHHRGGIRRLHLTVCFLDVL